jgi:hypothetical protein
MKKIILGFILFANTINCLAQDSIYHLGPDSQRKDGSPKGVVTKYEWQSKMYNNFRSTGFMFLHNTIQLSLQH